MDALINVFRQNVRASSPSSVREAGYRVEDGEVIRTGRFPPRRFSGADGTQCLLEDPIITVQHPDGETDRLSLPEVYAALGEDRIASFEALQAHQRQAWHCFLVQLAAMAKAAPTSPDTLSTADDWEMALWGLADGRAPWCLVVEDPTQPAFLQPPVSGPLDEEGFTRVEETPDAIDVLVTSKNHDLKRQRIRRARPEHWLYALVTLQSTAGYDGYGQYGILRMNGGYGTRPFFSVTPSLSWGRHVTSDTRSLLRWREAYAPMYALDDGVRLLWTIRWNEDDPQIPMAGLDPYAVEVCRRVRLVQADDGLMCRRATSSDYRVAKPDELAGVTGDPWAAVDLDSGQLWMPGRDGLEYDELQQILFESGFVTPPAMRGGGRYFVSRALVRGKGGTEGLHERIERMGPRVPA